MSKFLILFYIIHIVDINLDVQCLLEGVLQINLAFGCKLSI